jgi:cytochrome c553
MLQFSVRRTAFLSLLLMLGGGVSELYAEQTVKGNRQAGRDKSAMCSGCHGIEGYKSAFPELYHVPMIAGQNSQYLESALIAYKKGERSHPTMDAIAGSLSDQDIVDLAAYYASLK